MMFRICGVFLLGIWAHSQAVEALLVSPCPKLFQYEPLRSEQQPDRWYGIVTLLSDIELNGVWLRLQFDKPSVQLGNWFSPVDRRGSLEYLIKNPDYVLKANTPITLRFYVKYRGDAPLLTGFRLNSKVLCPGGEGPQTEFTSPTPSTTLPAFAATTTTDAFVSKPTPPLMDVLAQQKPMLAALPPIENNGPKPIVIGQVSEDDDDDFPTSDFKHPLILNSIPPPVCGTVAIQPNSTENFEGQYPWHAAIYHTKNINLDYICQGSLVSKQYVISLAHCLIRKKTKKPLEAETLVVYLGKHFLSRWSQAIQDKGIEKIIVHPDFDTETYSNDLALMKLTSPVEYNSFVRPVCVWENEKPADDLMAGKEGVLIGWGFDQTGHAMQSLVQTDLVVASSQTCLNTNTYCASFYNGTKICNGYSGAGMVFPKPNTNPLIWQLRGLLSINKVLQNPFKCDSGHYVVFTDIAKYSNWIKSTMI